MGAAIAGAGYAALSYFNKDKDVADSLDQFGSNVRSDARGKHGAMAWLRLVSVIANCNTQQNKSHVEPCCSSCWYQASYNLLISHIGLDRDLRSHGRDFRARADDKARDLGFK